MSPTKVIESILREMVDTVINGDGQNILQPLPPTELGLAKDTAPQTSTKWQNQCLYECLQCGKRDYDVKRIKKHCRELHCDSKCQKKLRDVVYQCLLCPKELSCNAITLESHVRSQHDFNNLGEYKDAYAIDEHLAAIKNLSDETAASIRSAELLSERQRNGATNGRVSYLEQYHDNNIICLFNIHRTLDISDET